MIVRSTFLAIYILGLVGGALFAQEKRIDRLIVANAVISENRVPLWIAKDMGLFEKHGLDVHIVFIRGAGLNVAALLGGDVQMAFAAGLPAVTAAARGAPLVILATLGPTEYQLVAQPAIATVAQLKGKTIGVANFGAGDYFVLRRLLPKIGLAQDKDVSVIPVGVTQSYEKLKILLAGKIDATLSTSESVARFKLEGNRLSILADTVKDGIDVSGTDIFTTRQYVKSSPQRVKAFFRAFSEAIVMGMKDKSLVNRMVRKYMKVEDPKTLEVMVRYEYLLGPGAHKPYPLEKALDLDIQDQSNTVPELKGRKAAEFIDTSPLRDVEKEGVFSPKL